MYIVRTSRGIRRFRGMGQNPVTGPSVSDILASEAQVGGTPAGTGTVGSPLTPAGIAYCAANASSVLGWLTTPSCWAYSPDAWVTMQSATAAAPTNITTPAAAPVPESPLATVPPPSGEAAQSAVNALLTGTEQQAQAAGTEQMAQVPVFGEPSIPFTGTGCDPGTDPTCGQGVGGLSTTALIAIGIALGVGLLVMTSTSGRRR